MKSSDSHDIAFMQLALDKAKQGEFSAHPNPRVGCVIVKEGNILATGLHWQTGGNHAEVDALLKTTDTQGATVYVTLEPCNHVGRTGACTAALIKAKVARVVIACLDPNPLVRGKGIQALMNAGIDVSIGVLEEAATELNKGFYSRMIRQMPFVRAKIGMSLDAKVAMQNGQSQWITSDASREHAHLWRARSGAILTGSQTVLQDNCRLTVRNIAALGLKEALSFTQPLRVIVDSTLQVPVDKAIFQQPGKTMVATIAQDKRVSTEVETIVLPENQGKVDLKALLAYLAQKEINDVLVEAGPTLVGTMLQQGLIDELLLYIAPKLLGNEAKPLAMLKGFTQLSDHIGGAFSQCEKINEDLFVVLKLRESEFR